MPMRPLPPRRRRAAVLAASSFSFAAGMLPFQKHFDHGHHAIAFGIAYLAIVVTMISLSLRELIKSRQEEDCGQP